MSNTTQFKVNTVLNWYSQCKDLRTGVICDEREVRVTIEATEFCIFCKRLIEFFGRP